MNEMECYATRWRSLRGEKIGVTCQHYMLDRSFKTQILLRAPSRPLICHPNTSPSIQTFQLHLDISATPHLRPSFHPNYRQPYNPAFGDSALSSFSNDQLEVVLTFHNAIAFVRRLWRGSTAGGSPGGATSGEETLDGKI